MGFSYTLPPASNRDRVRFLIADTVEDDYKVEDEELDLCLSECSDDPYFAAAMACDFLSGKYAAKGRKSVGALSIEYSQMAGDYSARANSLRELGFNRPGSAAGVYVGGISKADKDSRSQDEDWERTQAAVGMDDFHGTIYINNPWPIL